MTANASPGRIAQNLDSADTTVMCKDSRVLCSAPTTLPVQDTTPPESGSSIIAVSVMAAIFILLSAAMLVVLAVMVVLYLRLWNRQKSATHEVANGGENGHHYGNPEVVNTHVPSNEKA
jgi:hypothetical protein